MEGKFKVGDTVRRLKGGNSDLSTGTICKVTDVVGENISVDCKGTRIRWSDKYFEFVEKAKPLTAKEKKKQKEQFVKDNTKYRVYATGCSNKGDDRDTLKEAEADVKRYSEDSSWSGDLLIQKITPICKVTVEKKLKKENL